MTVGISSNGTQFVYDTYKEPTIHHEAVHVDEGAVRIDHDREHVIHISSNLPSNQNYITCDTLAGVVNFSVDNVGTVHANNIAVTGTVSNTALETRLAAIETVNTQQDVAYNGHEIRLDSLEDDAIALYAADAAQNALAATNLAATNQAIADLESNTLADQAAQNSIIQSNHAAQGTLISTLTASVSSTQAAQDTLISTLQGNHTAQESLITQLQATVASNKTEAENAVAALQLDVNGNEADADASISAIEALNATQNSRLDALESGHSAQTGHIDTLNTNHSSQDAAIAALTGVVSANKTDAENAVAALQLDVNQNEAAADSAISAIQSLNTTQNSRLDGHDTDISNNHTSLSQFIIQLQGVDTAIQNVNTTQTSRLDGIDATILQMETKAESNSDAIDDNMADIGTNLASIGTIQASQAAQEAAQATNNATQAGLISDLQMDLSSVNQDVVTNTAAISAASHTHQGNNGKLIERQDTVHFGYLNASEQIQCKFLNALGPDEVDNAGVLTKGSVTAKAVDCDLVNTDNIIINQGAIELLADAQLNWIPYTDAAPGQEVVETGAIFRFGRDEAIGTNPSIGDGILMRRTFSGVEHNINMGIHPGAPCIDILSTKDAGESYLECTQVGASQPVFSVDGDGVCTCSTLVAETLQSSGTQFKQINVKTLITGAESVWIGEKLHVSEVGERSRLQRRKETVPAYVAGLGGGASDLPSGITLATATLQNWADVSVAKGGSDDLTTIFGSAADFVQDSVLNELIIRPIELGNAGITIDQAGYGLPFLKLMGNPYPSGTGFGLIHFEEKTAGGSDTKSVIFSRAEETDNSTNPPTTIPAQLIIDQVDGDIEISCATGELRLLTTDVNLGASTTLTRGAREVFGELTTIQADVDANEAARVAADAAIQADVDANEAARVAADALKAPKDDPTFTTKITAPIVHASQLMSQGSHLKLGSKDTNDVNLFMNNQETLQLTRTGTEIRYQAHGGTGQHRFMNKVFTNSDVDVAGGITVSGGLTQGAREVFGELTSIQAEVDAEETARAAADTAITAAQLVITNALDSRLDAIEAVDYGTQAELDVEKARITVIENSAASLTTNDQVFSGRQIFGTGAPGVDGRLTIKSNDGSANSLLIMDSKKQADACTIYYRHAGTNKFSMGLTEDSDFEICNRATGNALINLPISGGTVEVAGDVEVSDGLTVSGDAVFEDGFRIASSSLSHLFYVDQATGRVGMGRNSLVTPSRQLHVAGGIQCEVLQCSQLQILGTYITAQGNEINFLDASGHSAQAITLEDDDTLIVNDGGATLKAVAMSTVKSYIGGGPPTGIQLLGTGGGSYQAIASDTATVIIGDIMNSQHAATWYVELPEVSTLTSGHKIHFISGIHPKYSSYVQARAYDGTGDAVFSFAFNSTVMGTAQPFQGSMTSGSWGGNSYPGMSQANLRMSTGDGTNQADQWAYTFTYYDHTTYPKWYVSVG